MKSNPDQSDISTVDRLIAEKREETLIAAQPPVVTVTPPSLSVFQNRIALTIPEAAMALGLSARSFERILRRGDIATKRVGRRVLIPTAALEAWLSRKD